mmetsp:Transcript_160754/g.283380  ORF Transcript_160754/g.283380 Transcript_160754/m.283380 type:complete len:137 (-) Transcript_160754:71-481(-)
MICRWACTWTGRVAAALVVLLVALPPARRILLPAAAQDTTASSQATELSLQDTFPDLILCDPVGVGGCIRRCHQSVYKQQTALLKMCAVLRCINDCTRLGGGLCSNKGNVACKLLISTMQKHELYCDNVECDEEDK